MEGFLTKTIENSNKTNLQCSQSSALERLVEELDNNASQTIGSKCQLCYLQQEYQMKTKTFVFFYVSKYVAFFNSTLERAIVIHYFKKYLP